MKYILCVILVLGFSLPALATTVQDVENFITQNFTLKNGETALDATIRLLTKLKEMRPERETQETSVVEKGQFGRTRQVYETRYVDTGELISRRVEVTSYYDTGEINVIVKRWFDKDGNLLRERKIKYFRDGRRPVVTESKVVPIKR